MVGAWVDPLKSTALLPSHAAEAVRTLHADAIPSCRTRSLDDSRVRPATYVGLRQLAQPRDLTQAHHGEGRAIQRRGSLAVVVHLPTRAVITVLLASTAPWTDEECRAVAAAA